MLFRIFLPNSSKKRDSFEYNFYRSTDSKKIFPEREYEITCFAYSDDFSYNCAFKLVKGGGAVSFEIDIPAEQAIGEVNRASCGLSASPDYIRAGEEITWTITSTPPGASAYWRGRNNDISILAQDVEGYSDNAEWAQKYRYTTPGVYERFVGIQDQDGKTICTTNTVYVSVQGEEKEEVGPLLPITGQPETPAPTPAPAPVPTKIIINLVGREIDITTESKNLQLPGEVGTAQTFNLPIRIEYSDASVSFKTITFRYNPPSVQPAVCPGRCGDSDGRTAEGITCSGWIQGSFSNCLDPTYLYCFTCPEAAQPIQTPSPSSAVDCTTAGGTCADSSGNTADGKKCTAYLNSSEKDNSCGQYYYCWNNCSAPILPPQPPSCLASGGECADSAGITADQTKKCDLGSYRSNYTGCPQNYYCYTSCGPNPIPTQSQTETTIVDCSGASEFCADSAGNPKEPNVQCNATKAYGNNAQKDQWCQGGEPGWYCWLCQ